MAPAFLTVEVRYRRLWLLTLARWLPWPIMPKPVYHAVVQWLWMHACYEYRTGQEWKRLPQPRLNLGDD